MTDLAATGNDNGLSSGVSIYTTNIWLVTGITCLVYLFFNWYLQTQILTDQVYTYSLGRQVNPDKLAAFLQGQHRMVLVSYLVVPLTLLVKVSLVSLCLLTGLLLTSLKLPFSTLMRIVLFAESAFVTGTLLRLLILAFSRNVESLGQYMSFAPLSLYSLFQPSSVPNWLTYPLQTLDIFQAGYVLLLAAGLRYYIGQPFRKMLGLVLMSYGLGLACCMIGFAFISISFNP
jgi:hypothetical protein